MCDQQGYKRPNCPQYKSKAKEANVIEIGGKNIFVLTIVLKQTSCKGCSFIMEVFGPYDLVLLYMDQF